MSTDSSVSKQSLTADNAKVPLFALVIGIDDYVEDSNKLKGAVADADAVDRYLQDILRVSKDRIRNLRDKDATRNAIIQGFVDLKNDLRIKTGEAIFIYFAGHGSETQAPDGWHADRGQIQLIVPQDMGTKYSSGQTVHAIPDRTIAVLLNNLANTKGDNITVVFDCCHASSGTRGKQNETEGVARFAKVQDDLPLDLDRDIVRDQRNIADQDIGRQMEIPKGFLKSGLRSHVLLAACGAEESAWETDRRGAFTQAFLQALTTAGADNVTPSDLIRNLPELRNKRQNPQCEGHNKDRIFFNKKVPGRDPSFHDIVQEGEKYILKAGKAQGITDGSMFAVYANCIKYQSSSPHCTLRVKATEDLRATLESPDNATRHAFPKPAYARQVRCGPDEALRVQFTHPLTRVVTMKAVSSVAVNPDEVDVGFRDTAANQAEFIVDLDGNDAVFSTGNTLAKKYGLERLPHVVPAKAKDISHVLRFAARWNWHIQRKNTVSRPFTGMVDLEFIRLEQVDDGFDEQGVPIMKPMGKNMIRVVESIGVVEMKVEPDHFFGLKIVNRTRRHLYPYLFHFDVKDQSIEPYYLGSTGTDRVDPPLRAGSSFTIGDPANGTTPFAFGLPDDKKVDITFLKLFLTTSPTDLGSLQQASPFFGDRGLNPPKETMNLLNRQERWDTELIAVIQRAPPVEC